MQVLPITGRLVSTLGRNLDAVPEGGVVCLGEAVLWRKVNGRYRRTIRDGWYIKFPNRPAKAKAPVIPLAWHTIGSLRELREWSGQYPA